MRKLRHCICHHRPDLIRLADRPPALQTARIRLPRRLAGERVFGGGRTARPRPGEGPGRCIPAAFYWHPCRNSARWLRRDGQTYYRRGILLLRLALYQPHRTEYRDVFGRAAVAGSRVRPSSSPRAFSFFHRPRLRRAGVDSTRSGARNHPPRFIARFRNLAAGGGFYPPHSVHHQSHQVLPRFQFSAG